MHASTFLLREKKSTARFLPNLWRYQTLVSISTDWLKEGGITTLMVFFKATSQDQKVMGGHLFFIPAILLSYRRNTG